MQIFQLQTPSKFKNWFSFLSVSVSFLSVGVLLFFFFSFCPFFWVLPSYFQIYFFSFFLKKKFYVFLLPLYQSGLMESITYQQVPSNTSLTSWTSTADLPTVVSNTWGLIQPETFYFSNGTHNRELLSVRRGNGVTEIWSIHEASLWLYLHMPTMQQPIHLELTHSGATRWCSVGSWCWPGIIGPHLSLSCTTS